MAKGDYHKNPGIQVFSLLTRNYGSASTKGVIYPTGFQQPPQWRNSAALIAKRVGCNRGVGGILWVDIWSGGNLP